MNMALNREKTQARGSFFFPFSFEQVITNLPLSATGSVFPPVAVTQVLICVAFTSQRATHTQNHRHTHNIVRMRTVNTLGQVLDICRPLRRKAPAWFLFRQMCVLTDGDLLTFTSELPPSPCITSDCRLMMTSFTTLLFSIPRGQRGLLESVCLGLFGRVSCPRCEC